MKNGITGIYGSAFSGCTGLESITVPDSVTIIGHSAFSGCSGLTSITLPFVGESRKTEGDSYHYPFGWIFGSSSFTDSITIQQKYSENNKYAYDYYSIPKKLRSVTITGGKIFYGAFYNCSYLTEIILPEGINSIGGYAFYNCSNLTEIILPEGINSIGGYAFYNCSTLSVLNIPDSVITIDDGCFFGCKCALVAALPDRISFTCTYDELIEHVNAAEITPAVAPGCASTGRTGIYSCSMCGKHGSNKVIPALGHSFTSSDVCSRCGVKRCHYVNGDHISFGSYPQERVTDNFLCSFLEASASQWTPYGYYSGNGSYGSMNRNPSIAEYTDVWANGIKYRGVKIKSYRPKGTILTADDYTSTQQYLNGYRAGNTYWFKYSPIVWRVIDSDKGLLLSERALDSWPFTAPPI